MYPQLYISLQPLASFSLYKERLVYVCLSHLINFELTESY
jgi:hypothetical protein